MTVRSVRPGGRPARAGSPLKWKDYHQVSATHFNLLGSPGGAQPGLLGRNDTLIAELPPGKG